MSKLTTEDIKKLASLSRLKLTEDEIKQYQKELSGIMEYVERLQKVDIDGIEPTNQVTGLTNVTRNDEIIDYGTSPKELLKNAPKQQNDQFKVNRMVG